MVSDRDIWLSANLLVKQHGTDAPIHAAMHADEMLARGDMAGCRVWFGVVEAIEWLLAPRQGDSVQ